MDSLESRLLLAMITVNGSGDDNTRDDQLTLREDFIMAKGEFADQWGAAEKDQAGGAGEPKFGAPGIDPDGNISGTVIDDLDGDGAKDANESGISNFTIYADLNDNGTRDDGEYMAISGPSGAYTMGPMPSGTYRLRAEAQAGWRVSNPVLGYREIILVPGQDLGGVEFLVTQRGRITGTLFYDPNGNAVKDADENFLGGRTAFIDGNSNNQLEAAEVSTTTDDQGRYILNVPAGPYRVVQVLPPGWVQTLPNPADGRPHFVTVAAAQEKSGVDFASADSLTFQIAHLIKNALFGGEGGAYLKRVGGPVLAKWHDGWNFDPAGMLAVLPHLKAMIEVQAGRASLGDVMNYYFKPDDPTNPDVNPDSYPETNANRDSSALQVLLERMMENSDTRATKAVAERWGKAALNSLATQLGMSGTSYDSSVGAGVNHMSLADAAKLYEAVANGSAINAATRVDFYRLMLDENDLDREIVTTPEGINSALAAVVLSEAAMKLNRVTTDPLVVAWRDAFVQQMRQVRKGGVGSATSPADPNKMLALRTVGGAVALPFKQDGATALQEYVYGLYIENALVNQESVNPAQLAMVHDAVFGQGEAELFRQEIRAALATWKVSPAIRVNDVSVTEGDSGITNATFTVTLAQASDLPVTVRYATTAGSASSPSDFTATTGELTFAPGESSLAVQVPVDGDTAGEMTESFSLTLSAPVNGFLADAQGVALIVNDDPVEIHTVTAASLDYATAPQKVQFRFSADVGGSITEVDFAVRDPVTDVPLNSSTVTWNAATRTVTWTYDPNNGVLPDGNYRAYVSGTGITNVHGVPLDGDNNGAPGGDFVFDFYVLAADANRDRTVGFADLVILAQNYNTAGKTFTQGNFNYDPAGNVGFDDLVLLAQRYNTSLPPVAAGPVSATGAESLTRANGRSAEPVFNSSVPVRRPKPVKPAPKRVG